jgi:tetratricopeptide (TPR) repeat protein
MRNNPLLVVAGVYALTCVVLLPLPLFGLLHVSSSAVVAGIGFFASGLAAISLFQRGETVGDVLPRMLGLLVVPWALLTLSLLWRPNCGYLQGLLLFVVFAVPSVGLSVCMAYALEASQLRYARLLFILAGLATAVLPVLFDLALHPQFYTYNHVWGGFLGPIYDEELAIRPGLFFFRGLTLWWAVWLVLMGRRSILRRGGHQIEGRRGALGLLAVTFVIVGTYASAPWLGINTPGWYLQGQLGGHLQLERFDVYYDPDALSEEELLVIADEHRYRYHQLREALGTDVRYRIATYLYPDPRTKAALTGARTTGVAPTWLPTPQIHLLQERFQRSFAHELVHVIAREFGMPVIRASPAIGLVEGLAVALEPPDGTPSLHAQVAAALRRREALGVYGDSLAAGVARQLRPFGFWTGRGAVSYVTMGSFVQYLLDEYGAEPMRVAYASGDLEAAYGRPVDDLARDWEQFVRTHPDDPEAIALVMARFTRPSLFEQRCPHYVPPVVRHTRRGNLALERGDGAAAEEAFAAALRADPGSGAALAAWARLALLGPDSTAARVRLEEAVAEADTLASPGLLTRLGDAHRLAGGHQQADTAYEQALAGLPAYSHESRAALAYRRRLSGPAVRALLSPEPAEVRAEELETHGHEATGMAALLWADAGAYARAAALLDAAPDPDHDAQRLAWQARFLHAAGERERAASLADAAATWFAAGGHPSAAGRERDRAAMVRWNAARERAAPGEVD